MELKPDRYIFEVMEDMIQGRERRFLYLFVHLGEQNQTHALMLSRGAPPWTRKRKTRWTFVTHEDTSDETTDIEECAFQ